MFGRGIAPTYITDFWLEQTVRLGGKALLMPQASPAFTLDHRCGYKGTRGNGLQISFKASVTNPIMFEGVMKMVHIDQNATLTAIGPLLKPKI